MAANTIPTVSTLPPAPTRADAPADFTAKADTFVAALPGLVTQVNLTVKGMNDQASYLDQLKTDVNGYKTAAAQSVTDAANQVTLATTQANNAQTSANQAAGFRDSAQTAAAAAQSSAGLPGISGKADFMLSVNSSANGVEWRAAVPRPTAGTAGYAVVVNPAGTGFAAQMIPISPITKYYESPQQPIVVNGTFSLTHGLGVMPKSITAYLVCQTDFGGYVAGDRIEWPIAFQYRGDSNAAGASVTFTTTSLNIKFGNGGGPYIVRKDNGGLADTSSNFKIVLRVMG